jgi:hypothetical protein
MRASSSIGLGVIVAAVLASSSQAQVAIVPNAGPDAPPTTPQIAPRQHGPMRFHGAHTEHTVQTSSENWSGYAVTGTSFTKVLGSWIVPAVNCTATPNTYASFWAGIDGFGSNTVEQIGTDSDCSGETPAYYAWYEFYPLDAYYACPPAPPSKGHSAPACPLQSLTPGDVMSASITYASEIFTVTITDETSKATFSTTLVPTRQTGTPQRSSAEWIAEAPCCTPNDAVLPLSDFGVVSFGPDPPGAPGTGVVLTNFAAEGSNQLMPFNYFPTNSIQLINMVTSGGAAEANPSSPLSQDGSFTVTWKSE